MAGVPEMRAKPGAPLALVRVGGRRASGPPAGAPGNRRCRSSVSGEQVVDHFAVDVGEAHVAAPETVGQAAVIEAELMEEGGVEIVDLDTLGDGFVASNT